ncbi:MAG: glycosyltransferase, partial [Candidatus Omnitrophica bacterium]|nr:glycosyltransferase [Candidatus Omnitrophota bacterium]
MITKLDLGGAQKHLLSLIRALEKTRFEVFLFTARDGLLVQEALCLEEVTVKPSRFLTRPLNPLFDLLTIVECFFYIKKKGIEVVHTHSSKAGIVGRCAAALARSKCIIHTVHGWSFHAYQSAFARNLFL